MSTSNAEIAKRIGLMRLNLGKSKTFMADKVGVSTRTWSRWESGEADMSASGLARACAFNNTSLDWLLSGKGEPYPRADADVGLRLKQIRENEGEGYVSVAAKMAVDTDTLLAWEEGKKKVELDAAVRYVCFNGYSIDWLLTGTGEQRKQFWDSPASAVIPSATEHDPDEMTDLDLMGYIATVIDAIEPIEIDTGQPLGSGIVNDLIRLCSIYRIKPDDVTMLVKSILRYRDLE